jgi:hypothetical protein
MTESYLCQGGVRSEADGGAAYADTKTILMRTGWRDQNRGGRSYLLIRKAIYDAASKEFSCP